MNNLLSNLFSVFRLNHVERELFMRTLEHGTISATELARESNITRTSVYDYLTKLKAKGLVIQTIQNGVRAFSAESPEKIQLLLLEQEKKLALAREAIVTIQNTYLGGQKKVKPVFQSFEGRDELQQMMKDLLLYKNITVRVYWPILDIIKVLTPQFMEMFHEERKKRNIELKTIWPRVQIPSLKQYSFLNTGIIEKREVRLAPKGVNFSLGYAQYENKVRFISSSHENFGFLITSHEFAEMMKGQFDIIWDHSEQFVF